MKPKIGIIGGMGPLATTIFLKKVIDSTNATNDQDNIPLVIINDTLIPDRTAYLIGESDDSPLPHLINDLFSLEILGCNYAAIICNTSHSFYNELKEETDMQLLNMVELTLEEVHNKGYSKPGLMATEGTIATKVYEKFNKDNLDITIPDIPIQKEINELIYDYVKKNIQVPRDKFLKIIKYFKCIGCDSIILGCTELSVIIDDLSIIDETIIDSTTVISRKIVEIYNKTIKKETCNNKKTLAF